jgi:putative phage-type endonuclease
MKPTIIRPKDRAEWLKIRENGIGASEVSAVIGINPWESPFSLFLRKTKQVPPIEENVAMHMGHLLEGVVVTLWEEATGWKAVKASAKDIIYQDPKHPWRICTPDRLAFEINPRTGKKEKVLLEVKTSALQFDADDPPSYYVAQCQYQMHITGIHVCYLCWLVNGRTFGYVRIEYDPEFAEWLVSEVDTFWIENVLAGVEPEAITVSDITTKFPKSTPEKALEADDKALSQIAEIREKKAVYDALGKEIEALQDSLKLYMADSEALLDESGNVILTWKSGKDKTSFDSKTFAAENPDLYAKYCRTVPGARSFLIKKQKDK